MMAQFKSNFVAASSISQNQGMSDSSSANANKRPALPGFVSGGSIGGDVQRTQTASSFSPAMSGVNPTSQSSRENASQKNLERLFFLVFFAQFYQVVLISDKLDLDTDFNSIHLLFPLQFKR